MNSEKAYGIVILTEKRLKNLSKLEDVPNSIKDPRLKEELITVGKYASRLLEKIKLTGALKPIKRMGMESYKISTRAREIAKIARSFERRYSKSRYGNLITLTESSHWDQK